MNEPQPFGNHPPPAQPYETLRQRESRGEYALAEPVVLQIPETPTAMHYHTLFDISTAGYKEWEFALISALLVVANGVVLLFFRRAKIRKSLHVFSALVVLVSFCMPYWDHSRLVGAYLGHDYRVAEGRVENYWQREWYDRRRKQTNRQEGFTVGGVRFAYARGAEAGFTNHQDPRIPLRDGMTLRVCYVPYAQFADDEPVHQIIKLEEGEEVITNDKLRKRPDFAPVIRHL